jgi:3'-phosphoadenosine 5'-phosphosulfate (PAPS) 3'-phosphatase
VLGVVLEPVLDRYTYAVWGGGCWVRKGNEAPVRCQVSQVADLAKATLTQSHTKDPSKPSQAVRALAPGQLIETYSAGIKMAQVARGEAEIYVGHPAFHDWDACAGHILVDEAGGKVTGLKGEGLSYGNPNSKQDIALLVTNGVIHAAALARLTK